MKSIEWAKMVAENPEGHPRGDVEAALSMLLEALNALKRESEPKMLPCPFCGSEVVRDGSGPCVGLGPDEAWSVWCAECEVSTMAYMTKGAAVAAWNRRADLGETVARAWAVANAAARDLAALRRAPTDAERADMRDVIAAHERANERMRAEAKEMTERLALVTRQRDEAEARAQTVAAQVAASTHGHSEAGTMVATNERGEVMAVLQRQTEALEPEHSDNDLRHPPDGTPITRPKGPPSSERPPAPMRAPGERWWRIHRSTHRVELMLAEPPMEPRCIGLIRPLVGSRWSWRGSDATVDSGPLRDVMRSVEIALRRGVLAEEVMP